MGVIGFNLFAWILRVRRSRSFLKYGISRDKGVSAGLDRPPWSEFGGVEVLPEKSKKNVACGLMTKDCAICLTAVLRMYVTNEPS